MKPILLLVVSGIALFAQAPACAPSNFKGTWNGWGNNTSNTRHQTATTITADNVTKLDVKWAFGFPNSRTVFGQPSIVNGRVFVGSDTGEVYALNATTEIGRAHV